MARERFVKRGGLFVIIGRITNSAAQNAVTLLERYANPVLVGEVTASSPNFVGEDNFITLPYSRIAVSTTPCELLKEDPAKAGRDVGRWGLTP